MVKLNIAALDVPAFVIVADDPGAPVETVPTAIVAAAPSVPSSPAAPVLPVAPVIAAIEIMLVYETSPT
jgi:hypothetical protein